MGGSPVLQARAIGSYSAMILFSNASIASSRETDFRPQSLQSRLAGTHSGFATTLRVADANDKFFPEGTMLLQYEGTFMFDAVTADLPSALPKGQVIVRGVALFDGNFEPLKSLTFAIVGGTGAYEGASGRVTQSESDSSIRTLNIVL
jgi:hypothetical protein